MDDLPAPGPRAAREFLNLEKVFAECLKIGVDPHEVIAEAFKPEHIEKMGRAVATRFAMDLVFKAEGQTVNINGTFTAPVEREPISKTEDWARTTLGLVETGTDEGASEK